MLLTLFVWLVWSGIPKMNTSLKLPGSIPFMMTRSIIAMMVCLVTWWLCRYLYAFTSRLHDSNLYSYSLMLHSFSYVQFLYATILFLCTVPLYHVPLYHIPFLYTISLCHIPSLMYNSFMPHSFFQALIQHMFFFFCLCCIFIFPYA